MLVKFALDTSALTDESAREPASLAAHVEAVEAWLLHGVLALGTADASCKLLGEAIGKLPQGMRKRWEVALQHGRRTEVAGPEHPLGQVRAMPDLVRELEASEAAIIARRTAGVLGMSEEESRRVVGHAEVLRFGCLAESEKFARARELGTKSVRRGDRTEDVWRERLAPLADCSRHVSVVDRYALVNVARRPDDAGLARLLHELGSMPGARSLTVYAACEQRERGISRVEAEKMMDQLIRTAQASQHLARLSFYLSLDRDFARVHGRSLRFDRSVCEIDVGLEILDGTRVTRNAQFTLKRCTQDHDDAEARLRRDSASRREFIRHP